MTISTNTGSSKKGSKVSYRFQSAKHYKRGAVWPDGSTRTCTRCRIERSRARQAIVTALLAYTGSRYKVPVAYCQEHIPKALKKKAPHE